MPVSRKRKTLKPAAAVSRELSWSELQAIEDFLDRLTGGLDDALDEAQDLIWTARETPDRRRRIAIANKALKISRLCADAYVVLAEETAKGPTEAVALYRKGVLAGEEALGPSPFKHDVGDFWGILETRPYMRARNGLARALLEAGEADEAIGHYRELLRLNPDDNQGNRYLLAECLLKLGRDDELAALLDRYDEDWSAEFGYTAALAAFRRDGDSATARRRLRKTLKMNEHVPAYLLGRKKLPRNLPAHLQVGGITEAQDYARRYGVRWEHTAGASQWLSENALTAKPRAARPATLFGGNAG